MPSSVSLTALAPGYGETPLDSEEAGALTAQARALLGGDPTKADLYEAEQAVLAEVSERLLDTVADGAGGVTVEDRTAVVTMTLTSAACPLTSIMEDQIRAGLAALTEIGDLRVHWQWLPPWRPDDISASGREQLRAVGFTI